MRGHDELMERLAAADPVRDREPLTPDAQREADAMLARLLATPATEPRRTRVRPRVLAVAGAACVALAVFIAINLLGSKAPGPSVVDRAVAAVSRGGVYHVVEAMTFRTEGARQAPQELSFESWYTADGRLHRNSSTVREGQKVAEEIAGWRRPGHSAGSALQWDLSSNTIGEGGFAGGAALPFLDPFTDPGAQLQTLEKKGRLRAAGTTTVGGKRAYRLESGKVAVDKDQMEVEITVDAKTYLPLTQRLTLKTAAGPKFVAVTRYRVYERVALNDKTERRLALDRHPGANCSAGAHELTDKSLGYPNPCAKYEDAVS
jgi:hypothetical protein